MSKVSTLIFLFSILLLILHIWAGLEPSHWNWGLHFFAFFNPLINYFLIFVTICIFFPPIQKYIISQIGRLQKIFQKVPKLLPPILLIVALIFISMILSPKVHLLGDGALLIRVIQGLHITEELPPAFNHQPIVGHIFKLLQQYYKSDVTFQPEALFLIIGLVCGSIFLLLLYFFINTLKIPNVEKILIGIFLFFAGGSQFFLGYVELYVFFYLTMFAYLVSGWLTIEKNLTVLAPVLCFIIMLGLHTSSIFLLPSLIVLLIVTFKRQKQAAYIITAMLLIGIIYLFVVGIVNPDNLISRIENEFKYNILPLSFKDDFFPYTIFSITHIIDWLNANLLIVPFGLIIAIIFLIILRREINWKEPMFIFLSISAFCGIIFTFIVNSGLGLARDWDFISSFFLPLLAFDIYLFKHFKGHSEFQRSLLVITTITIIHWFGWVGVNADEKAHLSRFLLLNNTTFLGKVPRLNYYETLGNFYYHRGDFKQARIFWEQYYSIDSANVRTVANLSDVYKKLGDTVKTFELLQRAASLKSPNPSVYLNLGVMYAQRGDTARAIELGYHTLKLDPNNSKAHANLGILMSKQGNYQNAINHLTKAIQLGLTEPLLLREVAVAYYFQQDYNLALRYFDAYLERQPNDEYTRMIRNNLQKLLSNQNFQRK